MAGKKLLFLMLAMFKIMAPSGAQFPVLSSQDMEDRLYRDESAHVPEPETEAYDDSGRFPLDLNAASAEELESSGLLTPYQVHQLVKYRERFGPLYSIYELAALPGFHPKGLEQLAARVSFSMEKAPERKTARHMALLTLERSYPASEGSEDHTGSPLKSSLRILSRPSSKLTLALSYEKDAGEAYSYRNRPQFLSAYLSYEGKGCIKQVVAGNYKMNQGLGLVNGDGFLYRAGELRINRRSLSRLKPYASLGESRYEQGLACSLGTPRILCLIWASCHSFSLTPSAISAHPGTDQWLAYQYGSGLFRSLKELEYRDLATRIHAGMQVLYRNRGLSLGMLSGREWVLPSKMVLEYLDKLPEISRHQHLSLHGNWFRNRIQVFGELAASESLSLAFLLGVSCQFNDFIRGNLLLHHYGTGYRGSLPSSYGSGSRIQNDQGLAFHLHMESGRALIIKLTGELSRYPAPRHMAQVPSEGCKLDLSLQNPGNSTLQWRARLVSKCWQTTPADGHTPVRPLLSSTIHRIEGQLIYRLQEHFSWMSRLVMGYYSQGHRCSTGYAIAQQLSYIRDPLKITAQCVLFHIEDWANRVYLHEPGFYYSFSFPVYYGSGQKSTLLLSCNIANGLRAGIRISSTRKDGDQDLDVGIQLQLRI